MFSYQNCAKHNTEGIASFNYFNSVYLKSELDKVVDNKCASCHATGAYAADYFDVAKRGLPLPDLKDSNNLIASGLVSPGNPGDSDFYTRIVDEINVNYIGLLEDKELTAIKNWICFLDVDNNCGLIVPIGFDPALLDNAPVATLTQLRTEVFGDGGANNGYGCTSCHSNNPGRPQFLNYQNLLTSVVPGNPAASELYNSVASGDMPRPAQSNPLSAEDLVKVYTWILNGAQDN